MEQTLEETTEYLEKLPWDQITFPKLGFAFDVKSTAFTLFGFDVKWYGLIIAIGMLLAVIYCFRRMKDFGLDGDKVIDCVMVGLVGAIVCARLYYVIFNIDQYKDIKSVFSIRNGGLAIYGGLIGAILFGGLMAKKRKVKLLPLLDIASMGFLIGQGIGRWGNFFNHEAFGSNTSLPWGMSSGRIQNYILNHADEIYNRSGIVVDPYVAVHPCFLYESLWCLLGVLLLHLYYKKRKYDGEILLMYSCWYGFERMFVEGLRTDSLYIGGVRVSQVLAAVIFAVSLILLIAMRIRIKKKGAPVLYVNTEESKEMLRRAEEEYKAEEERRKAKKNKTDKTLTAEQRIIDEEPAEEKDNNTEEENENGKAD